MTRHWGYLCLHPHIEPYALELKFAVFCHNPCLKYLGSKNSISKLASLVPENPMTSSPSNHKYASTCEKYVGISF